MLFDIKNFIRYKNNIVFKFLKKKLDSDQGILIATNDI